MQLLCSLLMLAGSAALAGMMGPFAGLIGSVGFGIVTCVCGTITCTLLLAMPKVPRLAK